MRGRHVYLLFALALTLGTSYAQDEGTYETWTDEDALEELVEQELEADKKDTRSTARKLADKQAELYGYEAGVAKYHQHTTTKNINGEEMWVDNFWQ